MRTDAKPPLFSNESRPANRPVPCAEISMSLEERPPMTPSLTTNQSLAVARVKSTRTRESGSCSAGVIQRVRRIGSMHMVQKNIGDVPRASEPLIA